MKTDLLACRHIGVNKADAEVMLRKIGVASLDELIDKTIPANIRLKAPLALPAPMTEYEFARHIAELAGKNKLFTTYIGMGWYNTITPAVIQRNVFENPVWYTSYTPYQTEVSQGRLEALMNFQTAVCDLTAMPLATCSLLFRDLEFTDDLCACVLQYPNANGNAEDYREFTEKAHTANCKVAVAADILSLALLTPPGEWGADIVFGTTQRLGTPMFYGGPSAGYFATRDE